MSNCAHEFYPRKDDGIETDVVVVCDTCNLGYNIYELCEYAQNLEGQIQELEAKNAKLDDIASYR